MFKWIKKNLILIGSAAVLLLITFVLGRNTNGRGVRSDNGLAEQGEQLADGIGRSIDEIDGEREALRENHRVIETANKSVRTELEHAIRVLELAKERAISS